MEYKDTIFLPKTSFEMRANLPSKEPKILEDWDKQNIYSQLRKQSKGREKFVLHDGPPYANGHIHMGTALNKILKDVIVRTQQMAGKDSIVLVSDSRFSSQKTPLPCTKVLLEGFHTHLLGQRTQKR